MNGLLEEAVVIECDGEQMIGIVHRAANGRQAIGVLVVVGGPQYRAGSHRQFTLMARQFAIAGFPVMRFDMRGMGDSTGESAGFERTARDIESGIEAFFRAVPSLERIALWGLCDGASAIVIHGCRDARVQGLMLVNPWVQSEAREADSYIRHYYGRRLLQRAFWRKLLSFRVDVIAAVRDWFHRRIVARRKGDTTRYVQQMLAGFRKFEGPALILLSEHDLVARQFSELFRCDAGWRRVIERTGVAVVDIAGADHTFSLRATLDSASRICLDWLGRNEIGATGSLKQPVSQS